jgi:hypothetical protein
VGEGVADVLRIHGVPSQVVGDIGNQLSLALGGRATDRDIGPTSS